MVKGPNLSDAEKAQIDVLAAQNYSGMKIGEAIGRTKSCVNGYLARKKSNRSSVIIGRPRKLSDRAVRAIVNIARSEKLTASKVLDKVPINVSVRTIQRTLNECEHMHFGPMQVRPRLTADHIKKRLKWCKDHSKKLVEDWTNVVFTDEKRFVLDGPDGQAKYWSDKRLPKEIFSKRPRGGGGVMVWAGISSKGKTPLVVFNGNLDAVNYASMLAEQFLPFMDKFYPKGCILKQNNAPAYSAKHTRDWFMDTGITNSVIKKFFQHESNKIYSSEYLSPILSKILDPRTNHSIPY